MLFKPAQTSVEYSISTVWKSEVIEILESILANKNYHIGKSSCRGKYITSISLFPSTFNKEWFNVLYVYAIYVDLPA